MFNHITQSSKAEVAWRGILEQNLSTSWFTMPEVAPPPDLKNLDRQQFALLFRPGTASYQR
jgi:hypothetical protein